jgi:hypothetical protein
LLPVISPPASSHHGYGHGIRGAPGQRLRGGPGEQTRPHGTPRHRRSLPSPASTAEGSRANCQEGTCACDLRDSFKSRRRQDKTASSSRQRSLPHAAKAGAASALACRRPQHRLRTLSARPYALLPRTPTSAHSPPPTARPWHLSALTGSTPNLAWENNSRFPLTKTQLW